MMIIGNVKHQAAVEKTAARVAELHAEISTSLEKIVVLAGRLDDLADTRQSAGLGFMTEQTKQLANKQTERDRAAARNQHAPRQHVGLKFLNAAAVLGSGQVQAPVTINAVSVAAEIRYALLHHLRRMSRTALLRVLEEEQASAEDHGACPWPRSAITSTALDTDATTRVLAERLQLLVAGYRNRLNLQALSRELQHLEERARDVIDGPARTNHPDPCPWCGRRSLVILHRQDGQDVQIVRCEGHHACECDHEFCDCHRNPTRNRHEWINSGRAAHTWHGLHNLQTKRKELAILETKALDAIDQIRELHQPVAYYPDADDCNDPTHADQHVEAHLSNDAICTACPPTRHVCSTCVDPEPDEYVQSPLAWPCPTVQACDLDNTLSPDTQESPMNTTQQARP